MAKIGYNGFTLTELLISLAILAEIATFTIPKILTAQMNGKYNASAKEAVAMVASSFATYQSSNTVSASTGVANLTQYMNYIKVDTSSMGDDTPNASAGTVCGTGNLRCLRLHSGGLLIYDSSNTLGGTATTNAVWFNYDPDGGQSVIGSSTSFFLYANGRIADKVLATPSTVLYGGAATVGAGYNPSWFSW